jgi:signal transduction histidine kinase
VSLGKQLTVALLVLALVPGTVVSVIALRQVIQINQLWEGAGMEEALASSVTVAKQSLQRMERDLELASGPLIERWKGTAPDFDHQPSEKLFVSRFLDDLDLAFVQVYAPDSTGDYHLESAVYSNKKKVQPFSIDEEIDRWQAGHGALQSTTGAFARIEELKDGRRIAIGYLLAPDFFGRLSELQLGLGTYRALSVYARVFRTYLLVLLACILVAVAGLSMGAAWFLSGRLAGPVTSLAQDIKGMGADPMAIRMVKPADHASQEVVALANELNTLTRQLRAKQIELMRAERAAGSAQVARHVAHEIKNTLATIGYSLWPLEQSFASLPAAEADSARESLASMHEQLASLEEMADTFSQYGRMAEPIPDHLVDLNQIARATRAAYAGAELPVRLEEGGGPLLVLGDENALRRAISNLVKNALEAQGARGEIVLRTSRVDDTAVIEVLDAGPGIPLDAHERIFDPGFSTKGRGSGIGLFMVRSIIDRHHGTITLESRPEGGTRARVTFPLREAERTA